MKKKLSVTLVAIVIVSFFLLASTNNNIVKPKEVMDDRSDILDVGWKIANNGSLIIIIKAVQNTTNFFTSCVGVMTYKNVNDNDYATYYSISVGGIMIDDGHDCHIRSMYAGQVIDCSSGVVPKFAEIDIYVS